MAVLQHETVSFPHLLHEMLCNVSHSPKLMLHNISLFKISGNVKNI